MDHRAGRAEGRGAAVGAVSAGCRHRVLRAPRRGRRARRRFIVHARLRSRLAYRAACVAPDNAVVITVLVAPYRRAPLNGVDNGCPARRVL